MGIGWNFYFTSREEKSASIALNFNLRESAPDPVRSNLLRITLRMLEPRPDGLSSSEESEALFAIEDALAPRLKQVCDAYFVARITGNNRREWLFYAAASDLMIEAAESVVRQYPAYTFTVTCTEDSDWSVFLEEIYPSDEEEQWVLNRIVLDQMQAKGDKLDTPRDTRHFVYFSDPGNRAAFRQSALSLGYAVEGELESPDSPQPFSICVSKMQDMELGTLHDDFLKLYRASVASGGFYDGWECETIIKQ